MTTPKTYRCKHAVEAMQWFDTDENREVFAAWFDANDDMFETFGPVVCLKNGDKVPEGEWILWSHGEMISMPDTEFREHYESEQVTKNRDLLSAGVKDELAKLVDLEITKQRRWDIVDIQRGDVVTMDNAEYMLELQRSLYDLILIAKDNALDDCDAARQAKELTRCRVLGCGLAGACNGVGTAGYPCPLRRS